MAKYNYSRNETTIRVNENRVVNEHRAPTDESVQLLREMEEQSRSQMLKLIPVASNNIKTSIVIGPSKIGLGQTDIIVKYSLNDIVRTFTFSPSCFKTPKENLTEFMTKFGDELKNSILAPAIEDLNDGDMYMLRSALGYNRGETNGQ